MFHGLFIGTWSAMHLYVFGRAASVPFVKRYVSRKQLIATGLVLWASFLVARNLERPGLRFLAKPLEIVGVNWLGILFLLFFCILVADLVTGFGFLMRKRAPSVRGWALVAGATLSAIAFVQGLRPPKVTDFEVRLRDLPADADGTVWAAISDLHLGAMVGEKWLAALVAQVESLRPDAILILGDVMEGDSREERGARLGRLLRGFSAPLGVWAVTGNHEFHGGIEAGVRFLEDAGIHVLRNEWKELRPGLVLAGVDDPHSHEPSGDDSLSRGRALSGRPAGVATVFLSHRPQKAEEAARAGAGLMLSGHTHGGQIWPFTYVAALANPLLGGRYNVEGMPVIVCRGTGTWGPRMRLWSRSEILRITLRLAPNG